MTRLSWFASRFSCCICVVVTESESTHRLDATDTSLLQRRSIILVYSGWVVTSPELCLT